MLDDDLGVVLVGGAILLTLWSLWEWQPVAAVAAGVALLYLIGWGLWLLSGRGRAGAATWLGGCAMYLGLVAVTGLLMLAQSGAGAAVVDFLSGPL